MLKVAGWLDCKFEELGELREETYNLESIRFPGSGNGELHGTDSGGGCNDPAGPGDIDEDSGREPEGH